MERTDDYQRSLERERNKSRMQRQISTLDDALETYGRVATGAKHRAFVEALGLAKRYRKKVREHDESPFLVVLFVAIAIDFADATWILGLFFKPFLFYFLWGKGTFKVRLLLRILLFLDCIPGISWLPLSTISVVYAWMTSTKEADSAKHGLRQLKEKFGEV